MTIIRVRLCGADRKEYGTDGEPLPQELTLDTEWLKDLPAGELDSLERELDVALVSLLPQIEDQLPRAAYVRRLVAYLAARQAGQCTPWDEFQPRLLRAEFVQEAASPPAGPSEDSSEG